MRGKKDLAKLVKKIIIDKNGITRIVWVKPNKPSKKSKKKEIETSNNSTNERNFKIIPTEDLIREAIELGIQWKESTDSRINRMRVIMAIKKANVNAGDKPSEKPTLNNKQYSWKSEEEKRFESLKPTGEQVKLGRQYGILPKDKSSENFLKSLEEESSVISNEELIKNLPKGTKDAVEWTQDYINEVWSYQSPVRIYEGFMNHRRVAEDIEKELDSKFLGIHRKLTRDSEYFTEFRAALMGLNWVYLPDREKNLMELLKDTPELVQMYKESTANLSEEQLYLRSMILKSSASSLKTHKMIEINELVSGITKDIQKSLNIIENLKTSKRLRKAIEKEAGVPEKELTEYLVNIEEIYKKKNKILDRVVKYASKNSATVLAKNTNFKFSKLEFKRLTKELSFLQKTAKLVRATSSFLKSTSPGSKLDQITLGILSNPESSPIRNGSIKENRELAKSLIKVDSIPFVSLEKITEHCIAATLGEDGFKKISKDFKENFLNKELRCSLESVSDKERIALEKKIADSFDHKTHKFQYKIHGIYKVSNLTVREEFQRLIENRADNSYWNNIKDNTLNPVSDTAYHGTSRGSFLKIVGESGKFRVPKSADEVKVGSMLGKGIYLADKSSKSMQYCGDTYGRKSKRGILMTCLVSTGECITFREQQRNNNSTATVYAGKSDGLVNNEWCVKDENAVVPQYIYDIEIL